MPWSKYMTHCRPVIRRSSEVAENTHDRYLAVENATVLLSNLLLAGDPLVEVDTQAEASLAFCQTTVFGEYTDAVSAQGALIRSLRGFTPEFGSLDDERFDELRMESHFATEPHLLCVECWYWIRKLQARFFAGDYVAALEASHRAQPLLVESPGMLERLSTSCSVPSRMPLSATRLRRTMVANTWRRLLRIIVNSKCGLGTAPRTSRTALCWWPGRLRALRAEIPMRHGFTSKLSVRRVRAASSTTRPSPWSLRRTSTRPAASTGSRRPTCGTRGRATGSGARKERCGNSTHSTHFSETRIRAPMRRARC